MSHFSGKTAIVIAGPTAVGKTAVAIALAKHFKTEIISADSRQCYSELNIGVARPSLEELQAVPHHFIASHNIEEEVTASGFERYALQKAEEIFRKTSVVVLTGGTGLYIRAFCEGLDPIPDVPAATRENIISQYALHGISWLQQQVKEKDPVFFKEGEMKNPQRMMRALEVVEATGKSLFSFRSSDKKPRDFHVIRIGLELPREELYRRIGARTEKMMEMGLMKEAESLYPYRHLNALQTVGYAELFDWIDKKISLNDAVERIKIHTKQYAKRQMTWFRKDKAFRWFHPDALHEMIAYVEKS